MSDENWPAPTPRDEILARVAARGTRIRAVRGAVNALVILSVVGASALGVGAAIDGLGGTPSTEVDNIAMVRPEPPEVAEPDPTDDGSTVASPTTGGPDTTGGTTTSGPGTTGSPGSTTSIDGAGTTDPTVGNGPGGGDQATGPSSTTPSTRPTTTSAPATTEAPTTTEPVTSSTVAAKPQFGQMRARVDGDTPTGETICSAPTAELSVQVEDAEKVSLTFVQPGDQSGNRREMKMSQENAEWSATIPLLDASPSGRSTVTVTVEASGPGGTEQLTKTIAVMDCPI